MSSGQDGHVWSRTQRILPFHEAIKSRRSSILVVEKNYQVLLNLFKNSMLYRTFPRTRRSSPPSGLCPSEELHRLFGYCVIASTATTKQALTNTKRQHTTEKPSLRHIQDER